MRMLPNQFLAGLLCGGALFGGGLLLGGANEDVPATVRARQFEVVDEIGTVRLVVGANESGGSISVRDRFGRTVLLAGATEHGGTLVATNANERQPALIAGATAEGGQLSLWEPGGDRMVAIGADRTTGRLSLAGLGGMEVNTTMRLETGEGGAGALTGLAPGQGPIFRLFADTSNTGVAETYRAGRPIVTLSSSVTGQGQVRTRASTGESLVSLTSTTANEGQIYTYGAGKPLVAIASRPEGPTVRVFNRSGQPVITLGPDEEGAGEVAVLGTDGSGRTMKP